MRHLCAGLALSPHSERGGALIAKRHDLRGFLASRTSEAPSPQGNAVPRIPEEPGPSPPTEARTTRPSRSSAASTKIKVGRSVTPQPRSNRAKRTSSGKGNREDGGLQRWRLRVRHHAARVELAGSRNEQPFVVQRSETGLAFVLRAGHELRHRPHHVDEPP